MQTVQQIADVLVRDGTSNAPTKEATENDVAQMESAGDDIAHHGIRHCSIRREVVVADTLKRAISERMRVIRVPSCRRRDSCSFVSETKSCSKEPQSLVVRRECQRSVLQYVLFSQLDVQLLFPMSHIHIDDTSYQVFSSVCALSTRPLAPHLQSHIHGCDSPSSQ